MARLMPVLVAALLLFSVSPATAQWASDPLVNRTVADGAGEQIQPKVRPTLDGGAWVTWLGNLGAGYRPFIQRLTADGRESFARSGIQLANSTFSSTTDYDLKVDAQGNAIVAFLDNSSGTSQVTLQKVQPDGGLPWGAGGIAAPNSAGGGAPPKVAVCPDGTIVAAWTINNELRLHRFTSAGAPVAGGFWTLSEAGRAVNASDLQAGNAGGEVILLWVRNETTNFLSRKGLKIQKWDANAAPLWSGPGGAGSPIDVYTSSTTRVIQNGYFPVIVPDGLGGAVVSWYDVGAARNAWVQHIRADGSLRFPAEGIAASITPASVELRLSAAVAYHAATGDYVVGYERSNPDQSQFGFAAQLIRGEDGSRAWGAGAGLQLVPFSGFHTSFATAWPGPGEATTFTWIQYRGANAPMQIWSTRRAADGGAAWSPAITLVGLRDTTKGRLSVAPVTGRDALVAAWAETAGTSDIYAQNINGNGTLGVLPPACRADFNGDGGADPDDLSDYITCFFSLGACPGADFNGDGTADPDDLSDFITVYFAGC